MEMTKGEPRKHLSGVTGRRGFVELRITDTVVFKCINKSIKRKRSEVLHGRKKK